MEFNEVIRSRKSVRAYQSAQISDAQLQAVLEAAYNAPVGMGQFEKIHLTVVQNAEVIARLEAIAGAAAGQEDFHPSYGAPTLIYVSESTEDGELITGCNVGCIMENMQLAAVDQGLGSCYLMGMVQMAKGNPETAKLLGIPEGFCTVSAVALGYPVEENTQREVGARMETNYVK
ncbi:MAG: nitroreductase family protein [Oscillospiraceae bacterium]|nr:nitroreductase family protein [Oscillospiraceae bacterium]